VFTQEELSAALPVRSSLTVADRVGLWPEMLLCLVACAAIAAALRGRFGDVVRSAQGRAAGQQQGTDLVPERGRVS
jgi:hypothetical protein